MELRRLAPSVALVSVFVVNSLAFGRGHFQREETPPGDLPIPPSYPRGSTGTNGEGITGSRIEHHVTDVGIVDLPIDVSSPSFGAWVFDSAGFTFYPGTGSPDGTFSIPGVTADSYYLKFGSVYVVSTRRTIDLGAYVQGRADAALAGSGTVLRANLTQMNPWNDADDLEMISSNAGSWIYGFPFLDLGGHYPNPGDTKLDVRLDYLVAAAISPKLIDASRGDQATVFQLVTRPGPAGTFYAGLAKAYSTADLTLIDGAQTDFSAVLRDVPLDYSWTRTIDFPSIHPFRAQVHPTATFYADEAFVDALPAGNNYGTYTLVYADLVGMVTSPEVTSREQFTFNYGNPFPWLQTFSSVLTFYYVRYQLPETQFAQAISAEVGTSDDSSSFPEPFVIQLSPPQNFRINGMPATGNLTNISVTPTLTWDAPAFGQASYYTVSVGELYIQGTRTRYRATAALYTASSDFTIPPGVLEIGRTYFFEVTAHSAPGSNIEAAPFLASFPHSTAPTFSGIESP